MVNQALHVGHAGTVVGRVGSCGTATPLPVRPGGPEIFRRYLNHFTKQYVFSESKDFCETMSF
jgi:hypothetical protein